MRSNTLAIGLLATLALAGCAANPESDSPGSCTLNCSNPRVGAGEFEIVPYYLDPYGEGDQPDVGFSCSGSGLVDFPGPIRIQYRVYERVADPGGRAKTGNNQDNGGNGNGRDTALLDFVPRGGVGFEPLILSGFMSTCHTAPEHRQSESNDIKTDFTSCQVSPYKFAGIVTPKSEWCSDSCGNITYEVWPICIPGAQNDVSASVLAGAARVKKSIQIKIGEGD